VRAIFITSGVDPTNVVDSIHDTGLAQRRGGDRRAGQVWPTNLLALLWQARQLSNFWGHTDNPFLYSIDEYKGFLNQTADGKPLVGQEKHHAERGSRWPGDVICQVSTGKRATCWTIRYGCDCASSTIYQWHGACYQSSHWIDGHGRSLQTLQAHLSVINSGLVKF